MPRRKALLADYLSKPTEEEEKEEEEEGYFSNTERRHLPSNGAANRPPHVPAATEADDDIFAALTTAPWEVMAYPIMSVAEETAYNDVLELGDGEFWAAL